jgi:hypothetical protein
MTIMTTPDFLTTRKDVFNVAVRKFLAKNPDGFRTHVAILTLLGGYFVTDDIAIRTANDYGASPETIDYLRGKLADRDTGERITIPITRNEALVALGYAAPGTGSQTDPHSDDTR